MAQYRIIHNEWFAKGKPDVSYYTVESNRKTFWGRRWKAFTEDFYLKGGMLRSAIRFKKEEDAVKFIESQKAGNPINGRKSSIVYLDSDEKIWEPIEKR
jgi:hypothetical protein